MANFGDSWRSAFSRHPEDADILVSLTDAAFNNYLKLHRKLDAARYHRSFNFDLGGDTGQERLVHVHATVGSPNTPLVLKFLNALDEHNQTSGTLPTSGTGAIQIDVRQIKLTLKWPKLPPATGDWTFPLNDIHAKVRARFELETHDNRYSLSLVPLAIEFENASLTAAHLNFDALLRASGELESAFADLLVILLNSISKELAPQLIQNIEIPLFEMSDYVVHPSFLTVASGTLTMGAALEQVSTAQHTHARIERLLSRGLDLLEQDIANAGGLEQLAFGMTEDELFQRLDSNPNFLQELEAQRDTDFEHQLTKLPLLADFIGHIAEKGQPLGPQEPPLSADLESVVDGMAVGFNEHFVRSLAAAALPRPKHECSQEKQILKHAIKGRSCHWVRLEQPEVRFQGAQMDATIDADIGLLFHVCRKSILDCSWRWKCRDIRLSVGGRPGLRMRVGRSSTEGLRICAVFKPNGLSVTTNLKFPFNLLVKMLAEWVLGVLTLYLHAAASVLCNTVVPVSLPMPQQQTSIKLSNFAPFRWSRADTPRGRFLGHKIATKAVARS